MRGGDVLFFTDKDDDVTKTTFHVTLYCMHGEVKPSLYCIISFPKLLPEQNTNSFLYYNTRSKGLLSIMPTS